LPPQSTTPLPSVFVIRPAGPIPGPMALGLTSRATGGPSGSCRTPIETRPPERILPRHRLTARDDFAALRSEGVAFKGAHCLVVALARPDEVTRVAFVASRRGVGGAVQRNRARRRLREIVRRRWARLPERGHLLMVVAHRTTPTVPHQDLASDIERVLTAAGVLAPIGSTIRSWAGGAP